MGSDGGGFRLLGVRALNYVTNHVISHVPSYTVRHRWYERVMGVELGPDAAIHLGTYLWFYSPGQIRRDQVRIGARSRINRACTLDVRGGLRIGDDVSISAETLILTAAHHAEDAEWAGESKPVTIEDNVWVGMRAIVMPGITLGRGCVVAAGAVVTRDVPPFTIVFGSPARAVGKRPEDAGTARLEPGLPLFE